MLVLRKEAMKRAGSSIGSARGIALALAGALACASSVVACSLLLDWDEFSDGPGEPDVGPSRRGAESAVEVDSGTESDAVSLPLASCGTDELCSPAVPSASGWSGPFVLFSGPPGTVPAACDDAGYVSAPAFVGNEGLSTPEGAQCSCTCSAPTGRSCTPPSVTFYAGSDNTCSTPCDAGVFLDGGCVVAPASCPSFVVGSATPAGGSCAADGGVVIPPIAWSKAAMACSPGQAVARGSCGTGELCLPSSDPFCIMHSGSVACPPGEYYVAPYVYYAGVDDSRGCTECSCGAPSSGSCSPSAVGPSGIPYFDAAAPPGLVFLDTSCLTPGGVFFVPESCPGLPTAKSLKLSATVTLDGGACPPSGATATGNVTPIRPSTFCCTN
ncbi:MAG: hypothetical protein ACLP1X_09920 [Polyangiaceae bacterium]|jgi:hypothetical protein